MEGGGEKGKQSEYKRHTNDGTIRLTQNTLRKRSPSLAFTLHAGLWPRKQGTDKLRLKGPR